MIHPNGRIGPCCVSNDEIDDFADSIEQLGDTEGAFNSSRHVEARNMFPAGRRSSRARGRRHQGSRRLGPFRTVVELRLAQLATVAVIGALVD
jgi:hypothetical protein